MIARLIGEVIPLFKYEEKPLVIVTLQRPDTLDAIFFVQLICPSIVFFELLMGMNIFTQNVNMTLGKSHLLIFQIKVHFSKLPL